MLGDGGDPLNFLLVKTYNFNYTHTQKEKDFHKVLSSFKVSVKGGFGIIKARWCYLLNRLDAQAENISTVIIACFFLHNFCQIHGEEFDDTVLQPYLVTS